MAGVAISMQNTLRKVGADLRWQLEKCGISAEKAYVVIVVETKAERDRVIEGFARDYDSAVMRHADGAPHQIIIHGVRIAVRVREPA
jgi:hypothetical protein